MRTLANFQENIDIPVLIGTCSSDLIVILRREPHSVVTQLRVIPLCESSFLKVHLARGVTLWVPTQTPQPLVTSPGSVSTFLLALRTWFAPGRGPLMGRLYPRGLPAVA